MLALFRTNKYIPRELWTFVGMGEKRTKNTVLSVGRLQFMWGGGIHWLKNEIDECSPWGSSHPPFIFKCTIKQNSKKRFLLGSY
jgi:hypothetical protein